MLVIAAGFALLVFLVIELRVVVVPMAIAVLLSALLAPLVRWLHERRVPRGIATALVMVGGLAALGARVAGGDGHGRHARRRRVPPPGAGGPTSPWARPRAGGP